MLSTALGRDGTRCSESVADIHNEKKESLGMGPLISKAGQQRAALCLTKSVTPAGMERATEVFGHFWKNQEVCGDGFKSIGDG